MLRLAIAALFGGALAALLAADGRASLHHPEDRTGEIPVGESGTPEALPFDEFLRRRAVLQLMGLADWPLVATDPKTKQPVIDPKTGQPRLSERGELDARIKREQKKNAKQRTPEESVALAVDLLRFGRADDAEGALRGLRRGFLPNVTLAHIAATQGQWARAYEYLDIANEETAPASLNPKSPKIAWQLKVNRGALRKLVELRAAEQRGPKAPVEDELPDRIFDVNFVNDAGVYEPGKLATAEKAKLPGGDFPEAIATAQQLVLWFPYDWRLYWLLGELYAMKGDVKAAQKIMNECANSGRYSNRKALMQHREAVAKAVSALPPEVEPPALLPEQPAAQPAPEQTDQPPPVPFTMRAVWWYFGAVGVVALFALVRALMKRGKSGSPA